MENSLDNQYLSLNRDYLRTMDTILTNLENFNQRYFEIELTRIQSNQSSNTSRSSTNRWGRRIQNPFTRSNNRRNRNRSYLNTSSGRQWSQTFPPSSPPLTSSISRNSPNRIPPPLPTPPTITPPSVIAPPTFSFSRNLTNNTSTNTNTGLDTFTNILNNTLYTPSYSNRHPTYNDIVQSTTTMTYSEFVESQHESSQSQTTCPICREEFEPHTVILKINHCGHIFKKNSLLNWFETNSRCPLCRHNIRHSARNNENETSNPPEEESITQTPEEESNNLNISQEINNNENTSIDLSGNHFQQLLENNLTQVLDNLGSVVMDNLEGVIGQALTNSTDLSNNQIQTGFEYSIQFPGNSTRSSES